MKCTTVVCFLVLVALTQGAPLQEEDVEAGSLPLNDYFDHLDATQEENSELSQTSDLDDGLDDVLNDGFDGKQL